MKEGIAGKAVIIGIRKKIELSDMIHIRTEADITAMREGERAEISDEIFRNSG